MIRYSGKDIIKRAEQLADLENSDFISEEEKLALLNESFAIMYQKMIDANDKTWIKEVYIHNEEQLPMDFYQLSNLYVEGNKEPITKRNGVQKIGYEIKNNSIYFSNDYIGKSIVMEYIPTPPTIFIKEKVEDSPYNEPITASENIYLRKDSNDDYVVEDIYSDFSYNLGSLDFDDIAIYSNGIIYRNNNVTFLYNFENSETTILDKIPAIKDNIIYVLDDNKVYDLSDNYVQDLQIELEDDAYIIYFDDIRVYQLGTDYCKCLDFPKVNTGKIKMKAIVSGNLYAINSIGNLLEINPVCRKIIPTDYKSIAVISKNHVLTHRTFGNTYYLEGLSEDTYLEYPNNLFWVVLAYSLAISFKIKQSADISQLSIMHDEARNQFFDSISRDVNANYQIKNVYRVGTIF